MHNLSKETYLGTTKHKFSGGQGIAVIEAEYEQKVSESWHSHQNAHITLFLRGGTFEKRRHETHAVHPGSVLFYHSDERHVNQRTLFPSKNINVEFDEIFLKTHGITEERLRQGAANLVKTKLLMLRIYHESLVQDAFSADSIRMLLADYAADENFAQQFRHNPQWVGSLFELLNDCWEESPSLAQLSGSLGISPVSISKHFPRYFGCTYGEYMRRLKISRSLELLSRPALSLTEVALECGFADQSHFIRTFKAQTRFLPKDFRKL
ncbi:AraC family transcriptional regulator [Hymenobacter daecheongensis DSM 21074]|uniref:AraC family transcriptional regulator n=1 Tax=Hymenobacter daecheongensis DSM 21074 TaxID=1121955 RepID=A0A1M6LV18_9BACT|nr:AraC family transcriptional regulator [Hymenobacter daecheongensis]SHJ75001.1 AraC family transcriptional regulator [Hymenobacter daecheongensis DSM 21074]